MLKKTALPVALALVASLGCKARESAGPGGTAAKPEAGMPQTEDEKTIYALGAMLGGRFAAQLHLTPAEIEILKKGLSDTASGGQPAFPIDSYGPKLDAFAQARAASRSVEEKAKAQAFRDKAAAEPGAVTLNSGLIYKTLKPGTGASPKATDIVRVHYTGRLTDGNVFDSSVQRGEPAEFPLNGVIPCWTEGVQKMKVGEQARL